jgi:hypothetical protein
MNNNKFLTLLMGKCWHEPDIKSQTYVDDLYKEDWQNPDQLSNPLSVIQWMERNMPEVWEDYLSLVFELPLSQKDTLNYILDLNNLVTYLSEYQEEWGFKECADWMNEEISPACCNNCEYEKKGLTVHMASYGCFIKHPALVYLEQEVKDEKSM